MTQGLADSTVTEGNSSPAGAENAEQGQGREPRSRDRYGRERGPRGERNDQRPDRVPRDEQQPADGMAASNDVRVPVERPQRASYFAAPEAATAPPATVAEAPVQAAPVVQTEATPAATAPVVVSVAPAPVVTAAAPIVKPVAEVAQASTPTSAPQGLPKVQSFDLPIDSLNQVAQGSGLSWVNSDPAKIAAVQAAIAAEAKPVRVPRVRAAAVQIDTAPLVLVETKRDLRNMTLPFEDTPVA